MTESNETFNSNYPVVVLGSRKQGAPILGIGIGRGKLVIYQTSD